MKKSIIIGIIAVLFILIACKLVLLNKYRSDKIKLDNNAIFNETLTISESEYSGDYITIDNMSFANYFEDYVDAGTDLKAKYDENNSVVAFYSVSSLDQYVNILNIKNLEIMTDTNEVKTATTDKDTRKYLDKKNIKNDIDLFKHIKDKYYFKNTIFTSAKAMKINYLLNSFVEVSLPNFKNIILINGSVEGYILNIDTDSDKEIKEIHILKGDKQYIIVLAGEEIVNNEFITKLLSTVVFN